VLSVLAQYLNPENATELFDACSRKSHEQVEELLAARFPKPDVRDLIRRLPARPEVRTESTPDIGSGADAALLASPAEIANLPEAPRRPQIPHGLAPAMPMRERIEPLSADRFAVHFTADAEFRDLLEEVRALASHGQPRGEILPLMKRALEAYRSELRKSRFGVGTKPRRATRSAVSGTVGATKTAKRSRHVPASVAREVYVRDDGCCTFVSDDGRRCAARRFLEIDHVKPWAEGGADTVENLRLRCRAHNQQAARQHFGTEHIREAVVRARLRAS
jgi:HNH endonuclease